MNNASLITLQTTAVKNNISFLKNELGAGVKISAVVKANAYGHGITQIIPLFEKEGIEHFSVFNYDEAVLVRQSISKPASIMIMGWIANQNIKDAIASGFEFYIFNLERLHKSLEFAKSLNLRAKIHIEAETGMNRSGLNEEQLREAILFINQHEAWFQIEGFCTHLAGAESIANHYRIKKQMKQYEKMLAVLTEGGIIPSLKHVANSAAAFVYPESRMDMVRIGIMLYGFWSSTETFIHFTRNKSDKSDPLNRILGWKSCIMSIKNIPTGEFVGYGISYLAQWDIKTALIPVGYSCGYSRSLSNKGRVLIRGQRCGIIGMVNMNMIIAEITHIEDAKVGDEVVIIGQQGDLEIKVSAFSNISDELNYEILAHLPKNIERIII